MSSDRSLADIVSSISDDLGRMVRGEIALLKAEVRENSAKVGAGAGLFGGAGLAALFAVEFILLAVLFGLAAAGLQMWAAALIVGVALAAVAGVLAITGKKTVAAVTIAPVETIQQVKADVAMLKSDIKRSK